MLSQNNIDKLCMTGLYKHAPDITKVYNQSYGNLYHCKNWTFKPYEYNGKYYMRDTYWSPGDGLSYELTDNNFDEFEFVFDFTKVEPTNYPEDYEEEDLYYRIATNSGGIAFAQTYVKKGAKVSQRKLIENCEEKIENCEKQLEYLQKELMQAKEGSHYKLR